MSRKRKLREWDEQMELALHSEKARKYREESKPKTDDTCTMCGEYCALKVVDEFFKT